MGGSQRLMTIQDSIGCDPKGKSALQGKLEEVGKLGMGSLGHSLLRAAEAQAPPVTSNQSNLRTSQEWWGKIKRDRND